MILRSNHAKPPSHIISKPALCVVAQGAKWTSFGDKRFHYGAGQALVVTVEMPTVGRVFQASADVPFLGLILEFDPAILRAVMEEAKLQRGSGERTSAGALVTDLGGPLLDAILRLVRLLDTPRAVTALAPMIKREICYWLLEGEHGQEIAKLVTESDRSGNIVRAIQSLRERFREAVPTSELASIARLGTTTFHRRFKQLTSLTPLQYQKQLRLLEARRLMISERIKVEAAAFEVGYESASQFSREYSRMFGVAPKRDTATLRSTAEAFSSSG